MAHVLRREIDAAIHAVAALTCGACADALSDTDAVALLTNVYRAVAE